MHIECLGPPCLLSLFSLLLWSADTSWGQDGYVSFLPWVMDLGSLSSLGSIYWNADAQTCTDIPNDAAITQYVIWRVLQLQHRSDHGLADSLLDLVPFTPLVAPRVDLFRPFDHVTINVVSSDVKNPSGRTWARLKQPCFAHKLSSAWIVVAEKRDKTFIGILAVWALPSRSHVSWPLTSKIYSPFTRGVRQLLEGYGDRGLNSGP